MLAEEFGSERVVSGRVVVRDLRGRKDDHEIALLRGVNELTQEAILAVSQRLRPGMTDRDIGAWIRRAQERLGLRGVWVLPLLGETAAYPHGRPEGRTLEPGDLLLVDTGGSLHGYQSDNTRTWIFDGKPTREVARGWNAVRDAQKSAFETMRPGIPCRAIDAAARNVLARAGFGRGYENFAHRLGHGIGMDGHEEPYLDGGNELLMEPGMTFSDEPGIYLPGEYGIRLEDIVVVTKAGADHFGNWQAGPLSPGG
jgi:Xaa-Pro dipeptidase